MKLIARVFGFVIPFLVLLCVAGVQQILYRQGIIALWINQRYSAVADGFFRYVTYLGDGVFVVALGLVLFFMKRKMGVAVLASYVISGILAQLIKNFGFPDEPRPAQYFEGSMQQLHTVPGVELAHWQSFLSGHTTSAFAVFGVLAFYTANRWQQALYFVLAALVGYSRLYLFQHFLVDVFAGSMLGFGVAWAVVCFQNRKYINDKIL